MARSEAEDIATGKQLRASYLIEQTDYTEALAKKDGSLLSTAGISKATLDTVAALKAKLTAAVKDRALASADAAAATTEQAEAVGKGKAWLTKAILIGQNTYDEDRKQADEFLKGSKIGRSVPRLAEKMKKVIGLLKRDSAATAKFGATSAFMKEGEALLDALSAADTKQEHKKSDLPKGTREFYINKAKLYLLLKRINRAGHIVHSGDPEAADKYNLEIIRRRSGGRKVKETAAAGATS